ncbi:MAG: SWIM zinc finger family protein [Myxococcota bacterium]
MENRLPRGRTYLRSGSVVDLWIERGRISALVQGSYLYEVGITIAPLADERRAALALKLRGLPSVVELLQGKLGAEVMSLVTDPHAGLFPSPDEIRFGCTCPDGAYVCKHVAAVFYGVGVRLDSKPELLFELRGAPAEQWVAGSQLARGHEQPNRLEGDLAAIFGVAVASTTAVEPVLAEAPRAEEAPATRSKAESKASRVSKKKTKKKNAPAPTPARRTKARRVSTKKTSTRRPTAHGSTKKTQSPVQRTKAAGGKQKRTLDAKDAVAAIPASKPTNWTRRKIATRAELLDDGVSAGTISGWLRSKVLEPTDVRGRYRLTKEARRRLRGLARS